MVPLNPLLINTGFQSSLYHKQSAEKKAEILVPLFLSTKACLAKFHIRGLSASVHSWGFQADNEVCAFM